MSNIKYLLLIILMKTTLFSSVILSQDKNCNEIGSIYLQLPSESAFENLTSKLIEVKDYEKAIYIQSQKLLFLPDHNIVATKSLIASLKEKESQSTSCNCPILDKPVWKSSNGPLGADATSFHMDEAGGYWLGTGSSGGIYYSNDKGKSWEERNKGIGPWHISNMLFENDTLFIKVNTGIERKNGRVRFYYWNQSNTTWIYVPGDLSWSARETTSPASTLYDQFKLIEDAELKRIESPTTELNYQDFLGSKYAFRNIDYYMKRGISPRGYFYNQSYQGDGYRVFGFKEENKELAKLNYGFPRDMISLTAGNVFDIGKGNRILLSKSGPYLVKKQKSIVPMSIKGLVATDVRQMVTTSEGVIYGLVNESDIWKYKDETWICVFNALEYHKKRENPISLKGYDIKQLCMQNDGTILFSFCGDMWKLTTDDNVIKLTIQDKHIQSNYLYSQIIYTSAAVDVNGDTYLTAAVYFSEEDKMEQSIDFDYLDVEYLLIELQGNKASVLEKIEGYTEPWLYADLSGKVWLKREQELYGVGSKANEKDKFEFEYGNRSWMSSIASKKNGNIVFVADEKINLWNSTEMKWKEIASVSEIQNVSCIGFDKQGNLYVGSGKQYSEGCGGNGFEGMSQGLFMWKEDKWKPIINTPNTWVFSLAPEQEYGLAVGTSGSGVQLLKTK